jgi:hypothetical protein
MPLSVSQGPGKWVKDFQKSDAPQFQNSSKEKRRKQAIAAYLDKKKEVSEGNSFIKNKLRSISIKEEGQSMTTTQDLRLQHVNRGIDRLKSSIKDIRLVPSEVSVEEDLAGLDENERKEKLLEVADRSTKIYRDKIKPAEPAVVTPIPNNEPQTKAKSELNKATLRALTHQRNGGDVGKTVGTNYNGTSNEKGVDSNINYGLYPTSLTIEEYENHIKSVFGAITATEEEEVIQVTEEETVEEKNIIEDVECALLQLEDKSWQHVDTVIRKIANENEMSVKQVYTEFKNVHKTTPDAWIRENVEKQECGLIPLDELTRLYETGRTFSVTLIFRGTMKRLEFFWPQIGLPSREDMQKTVEKFYPNGRLLSFYPTETPTNRNAMILMGPTNENYVMFGEDNWGFMSETDTQVYETICNEEGNPVTAPILGEDNHYYLTVEDYDTGENKNIKFKKNGESEDGKSYLKTF